MVGQEGVEGCFAAVASGIGEEDGHVASKFDQDLPTRAAGGTAVFGANGDGEELLTSIGDHFENGRSLGAVA